MLQREKSATLLQIGIGLAALGLIAKLAVYMAHLLNSFAGIAIAAGIIMIIIALVIPGRRV